MKLIFVCSPFAGDVETNTANARRYCRFVMTRGHIPFAPHLLFPQFLDDTNTSQRGAGIHMGLCMLELHCDEVWVFGERISEGMTTEIEVAKAQGKPIEYFKDIGGGDFCEH